MKPVIFIDGREGTTGLRISERLASRSDIELIYLPEEQRKDPAARKEALNASDISFLCLPDAAAVEAVALVENPNTRIIDASTAHRTAPGWTYGFPELSAEQFEKVAKAKRVANPGCHASGFVALVTPLVKAGLLPASARLTCHSVTGYSGGGKKMIAQYEASDRDALLGAPRQYGLTQNHKHLKEMQAIPGLDSAPVFCPIVADFYSGMVVTVPLFREDLAPGVSMADVCALYEKTYTGPIVRWKGGFDEGGFVSGAGLSGTDSMEIAVQGNDERMLLIARFDNLGKGASGSAVECMNILLGAAPETGLTL